jgi:hypothetical protein
MRPAPAPPQSDLQLPESSALRKHGIAGIILSFYVLALVALQTALIKSGAKTVLDEC